jgi:hypothetical protein
MNMNSNYKPLKLPESKKFAHVEKANLPKDTNLVGKKVDGGLWNTPFAV